MKPIQVDVYLCITVMRIFSLIMIFMAYMSWIAIIFSLIMTPHNNYINIKESVKHTMEAIEYD